MEKIIRDGKVAVLYSPGYGAGWYSWNNREQLLYHPTLVTMVENGEQHKITEDLVKELLGEDEKSYVCVLGALDLEIAWISQGTQFEIEEYDGYESVRIIENSCFLVA